MNTSWNLPPGVTPSMLPGNSTREMAIERAMEEANEATDSIPMDLRELARHFPLTGGPDDAQHTLRMAQEALEKIQEKIENAGSFVDRVVYGDEPEK